MRTKFLVCAMSIIAAQTKTITITVDSNGLAENGTVKLGSQLDPVRLGFIAN